MPNLPLTRAFVLLVNLWNVCDGSLFDPHLFPSKGPFFEGWYLRITDFTKRDSVGLLFGSVLPVAGENITGPLVLASILRRECDVTGACRLVSTNGNFKLANLAISVLGKNVSKDPDLKSPANFKWQVNDDVNGGYLIQSGNITEANFRLRDISFKLQASDPFPWNEDGTGPEGWISFFKFLLPLHWFVFSLKSKLVYYELQNITSGEVFKGKDGVVHMEKNWGKSFPRKWIWAEGVQSEKTNASFAISGGLVDFYSVPISAYLIGYRNPATGLSLDFRPVTSAVTANIDGCTGTVNITVTNWWYNVQITLSAHKSSFSSCLYGPELHGFQRACVESYDATATFEISERSFLPFIYKTVDKQVFENVALEFGGSNVCNEACSAG